MKAGTKLFLLLGCTLVVALGAPRTAAVLAAGWGGPYGPSLRTERVGRTPPEPRPSRVPIPEPRPAGRLELARR